MLGAPPHRSEPAQRPWSHRNRKPFRAGGQGGWPAWAAERTQWNAPQIASDRVADGDSFLSGRHSNIRAKSAISGAQGEVWQGLPGIEPEHPTAAKTMTTHATDPPTSPRSCRCPATCSRPQHTYLLQESGARRAASPYFLVSSALLHHHLAQPRRQSRRGHRKHALIDERGDHRSRKFSDHCKVTMNVVLY